MSTVKYFIDVYFGISLFTNAMLFIPQIIKILQEKRTEEFSRITFVGFCLEQIAAIMYGYVQHDLILMCGYTLSLLTCGTVTVLIFMYRGEYQHMQMITRNASNQATGVGK